MYDIEELKDILNGLLELNHTLHVRIKELELRVKALEEFNEGWTLNVPSQQPFYRTWDNKGATPV